MRIRHVQIMAQEKPHQPNHQSALLVSHFTKDELRELAGLRERLYQQAEYLNRVLDEKHLRFARYLREIGEIGDGQ